MRIRILPYKQGSRSAKALAAALGGKVLKTHNSTFVPRVGDLIINWGSHKGIEVPRALGVRICDYRNPHEDLENVSNKLKFFELMKESQLSEIIPPFWTEKDSIPDEAFPVVCRTILNGHSGNGIHISDSRDGLVAASLYTKYLKKKDEYRVHCSSSPTDGECGVFLVQRKARRTGHENPNWRVRNHANGFVFVRNAVNPPACVTDVALQAFRASGLDFGAVDVIYNEQSGRAYVLEINTAPGLEGTTIEDYAKMFKETA